VVNPAMLHPHNTRTELQRLLQERIEYPERATAIDAQIRTIFEQNCAILVLDLSGFSRLTIRRGIVHFLTMVHRMTIISTPIVQAHRGRVVKQEADNLFAAFETVDAAIATAIDLFKAFEIVNLGLPDEQDLHASIGIGYGRTLIIGSEDLYGSEMNLACKLGEDLAQRGELLLTAAAFAQIEPESDRWEAQDFSISGVELTGYRWLGT
jgi:adenylate cyclase